MTSFSESIDTDFCDFLCGVREDPKPRLEDNQPKPDMAFEAYDVVRDQVIEKVEAQYTYIRNRYRMPSLEEHPKIISEGVFPAVVHAVRSMVGDDEIITSNSLLYCILCIISGPVLSRIKVSWEDVGFNQDIFNFTEGWVFLPPSTNSSFESVTKYARGNGVPFVLDPVKFKNLSAVRKQSEMERDLPSKFRNLAQSAAWTNSAWPTWALHQFALIIGVEMFDFMRSKLFPYLFNWEGGCGGAPPFNNLYTAAGAIYRYKGGSAKRGILGIMQESNKIFKGEISPGETFFTKNLHLAMSGDERWKLIRSHLEDIKVNNLELGLEDYPQVDQVADQTIPPELSGKSTIVYPDDALTGVAVSFLREKGYVMTELDLVLQIEDHKKLDAVWGIVPLESIADQIQARKQEYQEAFLQIISDLSQMRIRPDVQRHFENIEEPFHPSMLAVMELYYRMRIEQSSVFNSFIYNERIRIFKTEDVKAYFDKGIKGIRDRFSESVGSYYRPEYRRSIHLPDEEKMLDSIEQWMSTGPLEELLKNPLPPGLGPDDARITRSLNLSAQDLKSQGYRRFLYLVVSSDKRLINACQQVLSHNLGTDCDVRVVGLSVQDYLRFCLVEPRYRPPAIQRKLDWMRVRIYNLITRTQVHIHGPLLELIRKESTYLWQFSGQIAFGIEYDFPNINRTCSRFRLDPQANMLREMQGGFLSRNYVESHMNQFAVTEIDHIKSSEEFDLSKVRTLVSPELASSKPLRLFSAKGQLHMESQSISSWRTR